MVQYIIVAQRKARFGEGGVPGGPWMSLLQPGAAQGRTGRLARKLHRCGTKPHPLWEAPGPLVHVGSLFWNSVDLPDIGHPKTVSSVPPW